MENKLRIWSISRFCVKQIFVRSNYNHSHFRNKQYQLKNGLVSTKFLTNPNSFTTNTRFTSTTTNSQKKLIDLRSDTITKPTNEMLHCALTARTGDDVFNEDPTVLELQEYAANLFGKEAGLYLPTTTMSNLCAISAHCHERASEIIIGFNSHIAIYEGGNVSNMAGVSTRQLMENKDATLPFDQIRDVTHLDNDDHYAKTQLVCVENTHNCLGGVALSKSYVDELSKLAQSLSLKLHVDGARIFNSAISQNLSVKDLNQGADSVSICLSKGLGAPLGSLIVGDSEFIRLAKRARKRCGGGMRQAGVVASMGLYAIKNHVDRLKQDHIRAKRLASELHRNGFLIPRDGIVDTNLVFFALPENSLISKDELPTKLQEEYGVQITGGYSEGKKFFRAAMHLNVNDEDVDFAAEALTTICLGKRS